MRVLILALLWTSVSGAWAATEAATLGPRESKSSVGIGEILGDKKFEEDSRITDLELRAQAGSLSRYSLKFNLGYSGSPVNELSDPNRPNPDQRAGDNRTNLSGSIGLRYRLGSDDALNLTTGVKWYTPYQAVIGQDVDRPKTAKNYDVNNPGISYDHTYAVGATQMSSTVRTSLTTENYYKKAGQWGSVGLAQTVKYTPFMGRVILGMQVALDYYDFNRDYRTGDGKVARYYLNLIPSVEYKLSSNVNFNTSVGYPYQSRHSENSWLRLNHQLSTWRVGAGWAITHDIYINPYANFFAEAPAFNTASLNFNTVFSIF